MHITWEIPKAN